jgi:lysophospholipase L1-like esterase
VSGWKRLRDSYRIIATFWTSVCILFVLANAVAALLMVARSAGRLKETPAYIQKALEASYPDFTDPELAALRRESQLEMIRDPLVQHREQAFSGNYVRVDPSGFRESTNQGPWPPDERNYNVFLFGGSTGFGYGVRDRDTIASHLQRFLPTVGGRKPRIYNFCRGGFFSTQERILFDKLVTFGIRPDLAIFLDGLNDFFFHDDVPLLTLSLTQQTEDELAHPDVTGLRRLPFVRLFALTGWNIGFERRPRTPTSGRVETRSPRPAPDDEKVLDRVIRRYVANKAIIEALAEAYDVNVAFVWQPIPTYKYDLRYHAYSGSFGGHEFSRHGYPRMRKFTDRHPLGSNFLWCADIQQEAEKLLYVDKVHYSPEMSKRVARCIADLLLKRELLQPNRASLPSTADSRRRGTKRAGVTRVACAGDSNTCMGPPSTCGTGLEFPQWCELLDAEPGFETVNLAIGGGSALSSPFSKGSPDYDIEGIAQLERALAVDVDAVIFAFGTNDLQFSTGTIAEITAEIVSLVERARIEGLHAFAIVVPPTSPPIEPLDTEGLNAALSAQLDGVQLIRDALGPADLLPDGIHMNASGHAKRARAVKSAFEDLIRRTNQSR